MKQSNPSDKLFLAIDLGSTSFKAALFDRNLREVRFGDAPLHHRFAPGGRVEIEIGAAVDCLQAALAAAAVSGQPLAAIAITSQAQTFTLSDTAGRPNRPFVSWQDGGDLRWQEKIEPLLPDFDRHCSFSTLGPGLQVCQLARLRPKIHDFLMPLPSFFLHLWSGRLVTDNNIAAMSGLYSLARGDWWDQALAVCGLEPSQLPEVLPIGTVAGSTTASAGKFGLPAGVPLVVAGNDQTGGGYGARLDENESLLLTLGTALVAYSYVNRLPPPVPGLARGPYPKSGAYQMVTSSRGGNIINWGKKIIAECDTDDRFFAAANQAAPDCNGLIFDCGIKESNGGWRHLGLHHTRADLARSIINSIADEAAAMIAALTNHRGPRNILAAGGGRFRPLWMNTVAARIGVEVAPTSATPLTGAARMAIEAAGDQA